MALEWVTTMMSDGIDADDAFEYLLRVCIDEDDVYPAEVVEGLLKVYLALNEDEKRFSYSADDSYAFMWCGYEMERPGQDPMNCGFEWPHQMPPGLTYPVKLLVMLGKMQGQREKAQIRAFAEYRKQQEEANGEA